MAGSKSLLVAKLNKFTPKMSSKFRINFNMSAGNYVIKTDIFIIILANHNFGDSLFSRRGLLTAKYALTHLWFFTATIVIYARIVNIAYTTPTMP